MNHLELFENIAKRPGMYLPEETLVSYISFIQGYDTGLNGAPLSGFKDWLVFRGVIENDKAWQGISREINGQNEQEKITALFTIISEFWSYRESFGFSD